MNTPIETDQGIVMIQELKPEVHTIKREPIVAITRTISLDDFLICFEKHTFERNCPSERTIVSKEHKILYKDKMVSAYKLMIPRFENFVHKIPYDGQPLYNILLKTHGIVRANNLVCETLNPKSILAQLYANHILTNKHVVTMNESMIVKHDFKKKNVFRNLNRF
jgi:phage terminase large subunit-like protein